MHNDNSRRQFLTRLGIGALVASGAAALAACGKGGGGAPTACTDPTGGSKPQRDALKYVDNAADQTKRCDICVQYVPGEGCGTCKIFNNTAVAPAGTCDSFAKKS